MPNEEAGYSQYSSYFPASYVKWLEAAGARVVPLNYSAPLPSLIASLQYINGALFTGGGANFTNPDGSMTQFAVAAQAIFNESYVAWEERGEVWPLWGTCQGHELISFLASGLDNNILASGFDSENLTLPLNLTSAASSSRMYGPNTTRHHEQSRDGCPSKQLQCQLPLIQPVYRVIHECGP
jgi:gamma-glutamyl hydrolase